MPPPYNRNTRPDISINSSIRSATASSRTPTKRTSAHPASALPARSPAGTTATPPLQSSPAILPEKSFEEDKIAEDGTVLLREDGDIILDIQHTYRAVSAKTAIPATETLAVRVHTTELSMYPAYFATLLSPNTSFAEGVRVRKQLAELKTRYSSPVEVPLSELPRVTIDHVGQISQVTSVKPLILDFLRLCQGLRLRDGRQPGNKGLKMPIKNVANLAVVADRFGAADVVSRWVSSNIPHPGPDKSAEMSEDQVRMRLCIGVLLNLDTWVSMYSLQLMVIGSSLWSPHALEPSDSDPLWLAIPRGIEEQLQFKRRQILQTFASLQSYILSLYASKMRNCRLGYDSSPQCDSFQLGEFVKFLARNGLLDLRASIVGPGLDEAESPADDDYQGDIRTLLAIYRKCPAYQLDSNHGHCGPKKDLMSGLDFIASNISNAGICWYCWQNGSSSYRWGSAKRPLVFDRRTAGKPGMAVPRSDSSRCPKESEHAFTRDFFLAQDKGWESLLDRKTSMESGMRLSSQGWILKHPDLLLNGLQRAGM